MFSFERLEVRKKSVAFTEKILSVLDDMDRKDCFFLRGATKKGSYIDF